MSDRHLNFRKIECIPKSKMIQRDEEEQDEVWEDKTCAWMVLPCCPGALILGFDRGMQEEGAEVELGVRCISVSDTCAP